MSCPNSTVLQDQLCYPEACPAGFTSEPTNLKICYDERSCESFGLITNVDNPYVCDKPNAKSPPCTVGETNYGGQCYIRCPPAMTENSSNCIKRIYIQTGLTPQCGTKSWNGSSCVASTANSWALWFIVGALVFLAITMWAFYELFFV